jgi:2-methylisocitrate lyase-like PEP mutase family enzyme
MDFITGLLPIIYKGVKVDSILVIVDRYTKFSKFFLVSTTVTAVELAELYCNEIELQYGPQEGIVSDRGVVFTSKFWTRLFALAKTRLRFSIAFHPQTDS